MIFLSWPVKPFNFERIQGKIIFYIPLKEETLLYHLKSEQCNLRELGFRKLVENYQERVYWHIRKMVVDHEDADDLTQETFVKVFRNFDQFRGDAALFTWIYRIASNECLNFLRKKKKRHFLPWMEAENELIQKIDHSNTFNGDEIQRILHKAILGLPPQQQLVFNMKYYENLKYEDIARITEKSVGACKANYHHAVKKIEAQLEKH
ncbi:DNA-directed RNA polymerase sigma-70 factor [Persicobacter diffluens]|uniref:RNA polymerase sigma factor n=1 Tax=Persicobacter diffluens TaxID=981 RepID=A0AAN4VXY2_9BACT|nr:DNA-directed RNA polymerase sigma-70 factor [Persicobacter diffluens]